MASLIADLTTVIERMYDRWAFAIEAVRARDYTPEQAAIDATEGWIDATYLSVLPLARLGGLEIKITSAVPVVRFIVTDKKATLTQVVKVAGGTGTTLDNLTNSTANSISALLYTATLATNGTNYLFVTMDCTKVDGVPTPAGVYEGYVKDSGGGDRIARIQVVWPG
jgi:hypothetical protein